MQLSDNLIADSRSGEPHLHFYTTLRALGIYFVIYIQNRPTQLKKKGGVGGGEKENRSRL